MTERWFIKNKKADFQKLGEKFGISPITARLLVNRDLTTEEEMEAYLKAGEKELSDPSLMDALSKGTEIVSEKIKEGKKLRIIGDYDVDGVCSTFILYEFLKKAGADVSYEIPDRVQDGYGINKNIIDLALKDGVDTLITCDNGIAAYDQVKHAKEAGMTVIVTDHHDIPLHSPLPPADAVVNPKKEECAYPFKSLCGAGVVYQFIRHFNKKHLTPAFSEEGMEKHFLPFTALATICDVMELKGENRTIVKRGLPLIKKTENIGLRTLLKVAGLEEKEEIMVYHCGFILGPMINASGRLESAKKALNLFLTEDPYLAEKEAEELYTLNTERKTMTEEAVMKACEIAESPEFKEDTVLVILLPDCHESIAGIIAGRVKERFHKPTLIFTKAERGIKGSGRSIEEYNMFEALSKCAPLFAKFGGHPMAAGFTLAGENEEEKLQNLDRLRNRLNEDSVLSEEDLMPKVSFDMVLPFPYVTEELIREFSLLEPYGVGNPSPGFARKDVYVHHYRILGKNANVVKLEITEGPSGQLHTAILFGNAEGFQTFIEEKEEKKMDIIFSPMVNEYMGTKTVQMKIESYR